MMTLQILELDDRLNFELVRKPKAVKLGLLTYCKLVTSHAGI